MFSISLLGNIAFTPHGTHYYRPITPLSFFPQNTFLLKLLINENTGFCGPPQSQFFSPAPLPSGLSGLRWGHCPLLPPPQTHIL